MTEQIATRFLSLLSFTLASRLRLSFHLITVASNDGTMPIKVLIVIRNNKRAMAKRILNEIQSVI